jgi:hypothetical protein
MDWTFKGMLKQATKRESKNGKTFYELVIENQGGKYPAVCVCTLWGKLEANEGDEVEAEGYMNGREYNGKYYAGLTCKTCTQFTPSAYQAPIKVATGRGGEMDFDPHAAKRDPVTAQREKDKAVEDQDVMPF